MKAKHARQIRRGVRIARNHSQFWIPRERRELYQLFLREATYLEWRAYDQYRQRHWTD